MKSLIIALALCIVGTVSYAQKGSAVKMQLKAGDTVVNTGTVTKLLPLTGGYNGVAVQINGHKISGTGAGTIQLYGSLDGVTYVAIGSADTLTNVTDQAFVHYITGPLPSHLKVLVTGSGTEAMAISVWYRTPVFQAQ